MASFEHRLPADVAQEELLKQVKALSADPSVHGILVQLPLPKHLDEAAVLAALEARTLGHYGCDVLEGELDGPIGDHPVVRYARDHSNVLITPHVGGVSPDAIRRTAEFMAIKVVEFLRP